MGCTTHHSLSLLRALRSVKPDGFESHRAPPCNFCQDCRVVGWGEGNGKPLQCSCLENPRDEGAWWAAIYGVAQSRTRLKWLRSSSSNRVLKWPQRGPGLQGKRPDDFFPYLPPNTTFQRSGREKRFPEKRSGKKGKDVGIILQFVKIQIHTGPP